MGDWYTAGILVGSGVALGLAGVAIAVRLTIGAPVAVVLAAVAGLVVGPWFVAVAGVAGSVCGSLGAAPLVAGTLRRGGTRAGTALLLCGVALAVAALAFVPALGYLEAAAAPLLGLRLRRRAPDRHAGLRTLARD